MVAQLLLDRAAELKRQLVEYSEQPRYARAIAQVAAEQGAGDELWDENRLVLLWDSFVLEHRLRDGRTVLEHFVDDCADLSPQDREMLLGWRDVVTGVFEVQRRDGATLVLDNLVDGLTYRAQSNAGSSALRRVPKRGFLLARLVPVGDGWVFSGPMTVLRPAERDVAVQAAIEMSLRSPQAVFRNPETLARAWELQRAERERFVRFFGGDLVVVPGNEAQQRLDEYSAFSFDEVSRSNPQAARRAGGASAARMELPPDLTDASTIAVLYDQEDGLTFLAEFGLVEEAFADPDLLRRRRYREQVLSYLHDDTVEPRVLRRLADRDPAKATTVVRRLLKRPRFDWVRDGEQLLRELKADYYQRPRLPGVTPVSDRLAVYARGR